MQKETQPEAWFLAHLPCSRQLNHVRCLLAGHDRFQPLIPDSQRMRFPLKHVGVHIMAHQRPGFFAARLMTDDRSNQIEGYPHLHQHGRERSSKVVRSEYGDGQCGPARQQIVAI